jgi:hypothetical protein
LDDGAGARAGQGLHDRVPAAALRRRGGLEAGEDGVDRGAAAAGDGRLERVGEDLGLVAAGQQRLGHDLGGGVDLFGVGGHGGDGGRERVGDGLRLARVRLGGGLRDGGAGRAARGERLGEGLGWASGVGGWVGD